MVERIHRFSLDVTRATMLTIGSGKHLFPKCLTVFLLALSTTVAASSNVEIPLEAILGNKKAAREWKVQFKNWYSTRLNSIRGFTPASSKVLSRERYKGLILTTIKFDYPKGTPLYGKPGGGVLALPSKIDHKLPMIVAIHGHEHSPWGQHPIGLFKEEKWPFELAKKGYVVWAPISMYHDEISTAANSNGGYPLVWVKIVSEGMNWGDKKIWNPHESGWIATGLSSGGQIAYALMAYRNDIKAGVFAGVEQDLDFLRREYRIKGHANCWDINGVNSFTTVQALLAPRPIQFQSGRKDPFFPNTKALEPKGDWFKGTSRGQFSAEVGGNAMIIKGMYDLMGAKMNYSFLIHNGGHDFKADEAIKFIRSHRVVGRRQL